jgi:uncharacterized protein YndB with AHSA1/START domain
MPTLEDTDTLHVTRRFKAARDRVFAAFATLDAMAAWFGPPGCKVTGDSLDFRPGGLYRLRAKTSDDELIVSGAYREITPPEKIVFTWKWEHDEDWVNVESVITLEFHAQDGETELNLTQVGFPAPVNRDRHGIGWGVCFDKLDDYLAASGQGDR